MTCSHCEELREEIAYLKSELGLQIDTDRVDQVKRAYGISPQQSQIILLLWSSPRVVTYDRIEEGLPVRWRDEMSAQGVIKAQLSTIRSKLGREFIETVWGSGLRLSDPARATLNAMFAA